MREKFLDEGEYSNLSERRYGNEAVRSSRTSEVKRMPDRGSS